MKLATLPVGSRFRIASIEKTGTLFNLTRSSATVKYDNDQKETKITTDSGEEKVFVSSRVTSIAPGTEVEPL